MMTGEGPLLSGPGAASDAELTGLLHAVYVGGGFTPADLAKDLFAPAAVRARGTLITARDRLSGALVGVIILVAPGAAVRQAAQDGEGEVHLLAVHPDARGVGVGRGLLAELVAMAASRNIATLVLSTRDSMKEAQALYVSAGFARTPERDWQRSGRQFFAYRLAVNVG